MLADGFQAGRLADDAVPAKPPSGLHQAPGAQHAAFLVSGGEQHEWALEVTGTQLAHGLDGEREKRLHVGSAKAVQPPVRLVQRERVAPPQRGVARHRVGVAGEHQPILAAAQGRDEVGLGGVGAEILNLDREAEVFEPGGEAVDHGPVAAVEAALEAADRWRTDQRAVQVQ